MNLREINRLVGKTFFSIEELTVEEAVERFSKQNFRVFTHDGCVVGHTKLKFDKQEYDRLFSGGYYIPNWVKWLKENSIAVTEYPPYSSDLRHAWQLVDELKIAVIPQSEGAPIDMKYLAEIDERPFGNHYEAFAETAPLAICLVALKSVGVEVEVNEE